MDDKETLNKIEEEFGKLSAYNTIEESRNGFLARFSGDLVYESVLNHQINNEIFLKIIIPNLEVACPRAITVNGEIRAGHIHYQDIKNRHVRLGCHVESKDNYVYWQLDNEDGTHEYGCDYEFTTKQVGKWLQWLVTGKNRPDRTLICPWCGESQIVVMQRTESGEHVGGFSSGFYAGCHNFMNNCPDTTGIYRTEEEAWQGAKDYIKELSE